ncbi:MAG TPA: hypothetical protein V6D47_02165 [Oscillatoriaceae cyanobacterium]
MNFSAQRPLNRPVGGAFARATIAPLWPAMVRNGRRLGQPGLFSDQFHFSSRPPSAPRPAPPPRPVAPAQPKPAAPKVFDLPGIRRGMTLQIGSGSSYEGYSFTGTATIAAYDARTLDLNVNASAMGGFVQKAIHLRFETQADGTVQALSDAGPASTTLRVASARPGQTVFRAQDGSQVAVRSTGNGGLTLTYGQSRIVLTP